MEDCSSATVKFWEQTPFWCTVVTEATIWQQLNCGESGSYNQTH